MAAQAMSVQITHTAFQLASEGLKPHGIMPANGGVETDRELNVLEQTIAHNANYGSLASCASANRVTAIASGLHRLLLNMGVEENGVQPVPPEERTDTQHSNIFTVFFTCLLSVLP